MTSPTGVYNRAETFSGIRQALKAEGDRARELARRLTVLTSRMEVVLARLSTWQEGYDALTRRYELGSKLDQHAREVERLINDLPWPKGGAGDLAKAHFGPPKRWLVGECIKVFFHHGDTHDIKPTGSKGGSSFEDYIGAVYELATGKFPWGKGVGLDKVIDTAAREYRQKGAPKNFTVTPPQNI
jgi:hypothetical protein